MKSVKGLIVIILLSLIIVGCGNKQPTPLQERNTETLKMVKAKDFVLCVDPETPAGINLAKYNNYDYVRRVIFVEQNDKTSTLYGYRFNKLFVSDREMIDYNNFRDCFVMIHEQVSPELIGKIILTGLQRPTSSAKPDEK